MIGLLCTGLGGNQGLAENHSTNAPSELLLALPKPLPAKRDGLPAGFRKTVPGSVSELRGIEDHVKALVKRVSPATVAVEVGGATGSGVVISSNGLVLTAAHVCGSANRTVTFTFPDGKHARGKTIGLDRDSDAGLMQISDKGPWPFVPLGELETANPGDWVMALGHPGGFDPRRSLVVRLGRLIRVRSDSLQTDCTISPGDSGGPLFDMQGRLIGIHTTISGSMSDNYHVPIGQFYRHWDDMVTVAAEKEGT